MYRKFLQSQKNLPYRFIIYILLPLLLLLTSGITFIYFNNDDLFMKQLASGELTLKPESHLLHIGYITGLLLSTLYKLFPAVPWYGILLFSYAYLGITVCFYMLAHFFPKILHTILLGIFLFGAIGPFLIIHLVQIQFTTVTAMLTTASLMCFYISDYADSPVLCRKWKVISIVFFILAFELRMDACIMFIPTFFLLGVSKYLKDHSSLKPVLLYGCTLAILLVILGSIEKIAYSAPAWESFKAFNTARANIMDYNGFPDYNAYQDIYNEFGITYESYLSMSKRYQILLDDKINVSFMEVMSDISHEYHFDPARILTDFWARHVTDYTDRPLNLIVYVLYFFALLLIIVSKKWKTVFDLLAVFLGRMIIWMYLLYINRPMLRVTQGIYIMECILLFAIILVNRLWIPSKSANRIPGRIVLALFTICSLFLSIDQGLPHAEMIIANSAAQCKFSESYQEMRDYFYEHGDNIYLQDMLGFSSFTEDIFQPTAPSKGNFILTGGWTASSPWTDNIAARNNIASYEQAAISQDNVLFVFMDMEWTGYDYLNAYLRSKYPDCHLETVDIYQCTDGLQFLILRASCQTY